MGTRLEAVGGLALQRVLTVRAFWRRQKGIAGGDVTVVLEMTVSDSGTYSMRDRSLWLRERDGSLTLHDENTRVVVEDDENLGALTDDWMQAVREVEGG